MILRKIKNVLKRISGKNTKKTKDPFLSHGERERLRALGRFISTETTLLGKKFQIVDSTTFLSSLDEIFSDEIYKFNSNDNFPCIIDCGANVGLASIFLKIKYSNAKIIAFEPDPNIFKAMKENVLSFGFNDIVLRNEAISSTDSIVNFHLEGGHSGMIVQNGNGIKTVPIKAIRLKTLLEQFSEITFLKIDIEGHEVDVVPDIADQLKKVKFMFLEYHSLIENDQKLGELLNVIKNAGLRYYTKEAYVKPFPFINREIFLGMDFLVNIYCYRD